MMVGLPGTITFRYGLWPLWPRHFGDGLSFEAAGDVVREMKQRVPGL